MIKFSNATFKYNTTRADGVREDLTGVSGLDLNIGDGEFIVLTGPSGCGKTTVIRLINGLIPNFCNGELSGTVSIDDADIRDMSIYDISARVGSVFQNPRSQFFNVNTTDEMAFAAENQCRPPELILETIKDTVDRMHIRNLLDRDIFKLSGGEKQIVACAGINVLSPDIIVLDEPSSNLDHRSIKRLGRILMQWKREGKTVIVAEHRLFYLRDLADRMIVMEKGRIRKEFTKAGLMTLSCEEAERMGLRPLSLEEIPYEKSCLTAENEELELEEFSFTYKDGLHSINIPKLMIPAGGITAVIGNNGAGKSTLARNICGLERRCKGSLIYKGKHMGYKERLHNCYMIMQDVNHQLFTESVLDEVMLSMTDKRLSEDEKRERAGVILEKLGLSDHLETHPMALSGGQKQRVAIASGIASGKPVIIFDEPTSGLDLYHMKQVAAEIKKLKKAGKTVIIVTHDLEFVLSCCDHIVHMEMGHIADSYNIDDDTVSKLKEYIIG